MSKLIGKIKSIIYQNDSNGYIVALFRVSKALDDKDKDYVKKSITITGNLLDIEFETPIELDGDFVFHEKFGKQFNFKSYRVILPEENEDIIEFLSSSLVKGCGKKTAQKLVEIYGKDTLNIIKNDKNSLNIISGLSELRKEKIYDSIIHYIKTSDIILELKNMGFSIEEASRIIRKHNEDVKDIIDVNIYLFNDVIDFQRLDNIFLNYYKDKYDKRRVKACIIESMKTISMNTGDIYYLIEDVYSILNRIYNLSVPYEEYLDYLEELNHDYFIAIDNDKCYLLNNYDDEYTIANLLYKIANKKETKKDYKEGIKNLESELKITYNEEQKKAITNALNNNITIISGGPGTGKTTIINAIVKLYIKENKLNDVDIMEQIALLAPTGRASKKMSLATKIPASTIHRYLKWNKDNNEFMVNENNKNFQKLIIIDEMSMIDASVFAALLKGIHSYVKLVLVGDSFQLPSVGPGFVLSDLIHSDLFNYISLEYIYRQSENSYIPYLAREIKNKDISEEFTNKRDDYNFIITDSKDIKKTIKMIIEKGIKKGYDENSLQILVPMYKGDNGIDSLNSMLCELFNHKSDAREITYGDVLYKEGDKVLQLVNDPDNNVFNGDIGYIKSIRTILSPTKKDIITIDFDGNIVMKEKKDLNNIRHAYAISIHKSQGSEFDHVIMPITFNYGGMLYNKILYTGVSRAKKSLILIGDANAFYKGVQNDYGNLRKTTLQNRLEEIFIHN